MKQKRILVFVPILVLLFVLDLFASYPCNPWMKFIESRNEENWVSSNENRFCSTINQIGEGNRREVLNKVHTLSIPFIKNMGQLEDAHVLYYARTFCGTVIITDCVEIIYSLPNSEEGNGWVIHENFVGSKFTEVMGEDVAITRVSCFKGNDPSKWRSNIPTYNLVSLGEVYKGIELKLKASGNNVEKLFYVYPQGNPEKIRIKIKGAYTLRVNERSELEVETGSDVIKFTKPDAYQMDNGSRKYIEVSYSVEGDEYSFVVGDYDRTKILVIDPLLASTFLGSSGNEEVNAISIDKNGNVFVTGPTRSSQFPTTPGSYDATYNGNGDVFLSKFDCNLESLLASTYFGGLSHDNSSAIVIDSDGNIYVTGQTWSYDFPITPGAYDSIKNGYEDLYISKFDANLGNLIASTYLGSSGYEGWGSSISIDSTGNVFVTSFTDSFDFPTTSGAYDTSYDHHYDVFVSKFDNNLENLFASTFLGGWGSEYSYSISIDNSGNVYVAGATHSEDFPTTPGAYDTTYAYCDVFVSKFDNNLENLLASTFLGSGSTDIAYSMFIDSGEDIYVAGWTWESDFPTTPHAYDTSHNGRRDVFVSRLDSNLENLLASTFIGGHEMDEANSIFISNEGNVYVTGGTGSIDFPTTPGAFDTTYVGDYDVQDAFISKFDNNLENLLVSTFLGWRQRDVARSISIDTSGNVYVAGFTNSLYFPANAYDTTYNGGRDGFISKFDSELSEGGAGVEEKECFETVIFIFRVYPNPFRDKVKIKYSIGSGAKGISLKIYDVSGREIRTFMACDLSSGALVWDGRDNTGEKVSAGVYFLKLEAGTYKESKKLLMVR